MAGVWNGKRNSVSNLYKRFEAAVVASLAIPSTKEKSFSRALDKCSELAARIVKTPSISVDEMLLKIRVAGWAIGAAPHKSAEELSDWSSNRGGAEEIDALVSLRDDLQRLQIGALGAGRALRQ